MAYRTLRLMPALAAAIALSGCISFGAKPPPSLLTLDSTAQPQPGQAQSSASARSIVVQVPVAPTAIMTARVPVATGGSVAYIKDAQWSEPPARLFARLLADTLTAQAGMVVLSPAQSIGDPSANLMGELRSFTIDAGSHEAVVIYDAALTRVGSDTVEKRRFEARAPVAKIEPGQAGAALNKAANDVGQQVAAWVGGNR